MRSVAIMIGVALLALGGAANAKPAGVAKRIIPPPKPPVVAQGSTKATCEITEIRAAALNPGKGVDGKLSKFAKQLSSSQFGAYNTFTLGSQQTWTGNKNKPLAAKQFTNGDTMTINFKDVSTSQGKKPRLKLDLSVLDSSGTQVLQTTLWMSAEHIEMPYVTNVTGGAMIVALDCQ